MRWPRRRSPEPVGPQNPIIFQYTTKRVMNPMIQASPVSVLLGLGLLVGRLSLIETCAMGAMGAWRIVVVGLVMKISWGQNRVFVV
jgi:hypothetical protein